jgi:hypothetical protein
MAKKGVLHRGNHWNFFAKMEQEDAAYDSNSQGCR